MEQLTQLGLLKFVFVRPQTILQLTFLFLSILSLLSFLLQLYAVENASQITPPK